MNVTDAIYRTVHDYPGGSESLAPRMGMSAAVLRNKVNPNNTAHRVYAEDLDALMAVTGNYSILEALAANHGFVLRRADDTERTAACLMQAMLGAQATRGAVWSTVHQALADNLITPNEYSAIDAALMAATAADRQLLDVLRAQVPKPPEEQG